MMPDDFFLALDPSKDSKFNSYDSVAVTSKTTASLRCAEQSRDVPTLVFILWTDTSLKETQMFSDRGVGLSQETKTNTEG